MSAFHSFLNAQAKFLCIMSEIEFLNFYSETRQNETSENGCILMSTQSCLIVWQSGGG